MSQQEASHTIPMPSTHNTVRRLQIEMYWHLLRIVTSRDCPLRPNKNLCEWLIVYLPGRLLKCNREGAAAPQLTTRHVVGRPSVWFGFIRLLTGQRIAGTSVSTSFQLRCRSLTEYQAESRQARWASCWVGLKICSFHCWPYVLNLLWALERLTGSQ